MKKAFTIVELLVAIGLMAVLLSISGIIFKTAVDAHRKAQATAEITQKLRAITDQLNTDFMSVRKDCPMAIWFEFNQIDNKRYDQILFFANSTYQSSGINGQVIHGNSARVYYGQANIIDYDPADPSNRAVLPDLGYTQSNIFARRQHVYSADITLDNFPDTAVFTGTAIPGSFIPENNDNYEYERITSNYWRDNIAADLAFNDQAIMTCFDNTTGRPAIDLAASETLHLLMCQGVDSFSVQWGYFGTHPVTGDPQLRWWPSEDPDGDGDPIDSDFDPALMDIDPFGIYFNFSAGVSVPDWFGPAFALSQAGGSFGGGFFPPSLPPRVGGSYSR